MNVSLKSECPNISFNVEKSFVLAKNIVAKVCLPALQDMRLLIFDIVAILLK